MYLHQISLLLLYCTFHPVSILEVQLEANMIEYAKKFATSVLNNEKLSLLSRGHKYPIIICSSLYLSILITFILKHIHLDEHQLCYTHSDWTWYVNFFEASCFCAIVAIYCSRYCISNSETRDFDCNIMTSFVSFIAGISSFINLAGGITGNCEDIFGVVVPGIYWAEWACCVPLLYYIVITTENKPILTHQDIATLTLIATVFLMGSGLQFTKSYVSAVCLLVMTFCCEISSSVLFVIAMRYKAQNTQIDIEQENGEVIDTYNACLRKTQKELSLFLLVFLRLFPLVYLLAFFNIINNNVTYLCFTLLNVTSKLIFTHMINHAHANTTSEITRIKLVAEMAANQSRRLFVRYIMHEVRVPLNSLTMGLGYLEQCPNLDDEAQEALLMMDGATGFMRQTLNDVLNMQRIEEGKLELNYESFSIDTLLSHVKASVQGTLREKQIAIVINIQETVPKYVIGDGFRIEHVIVNLISNALKFSPSHSKVTITITSQSPITIEDSHNIYTPRTIIQFSVTDQGPGIAGSDLLSLFTPFSQIKPNQQQSGGGSGIGLVICKQIVELHGGTISCQSTLGVGTVFTFSIPFEIVVENGQGQRNHHLIKQQDQGNNGHSSKLKSTLSSVGDYRLSHKLSSHSSFCNDKNSRKSSGSRIMNCNSSNSSGASRSGSGASSSMVEDIRGGIIITSTMLPKLLPPLPLPIPLVGNHSQQYSTTTTTSSCSLSNGKDFMRLKLSPTEDVEDEEDIMNTATSSNSMGGGGGGGGDGVVQGIMGGGSGILRHVLLVDDVLSNKKLLAMLLRRHHIVCSMAGHGGEALQLIQNGFHFYDMIFMDNFMPVMNGIEAAKKLREQGYPNLIIGLTGNAMEDDVSEFLEAGADAVLLKPVSLRQIYQLLDYVKKHGNARLLQSHITFYEDHYTISK